MNLADSPIWHDDRHTWIGTWHMSKDGWIVAEKVQEVLALLQHQQNLLTVQPRSQLKSQEIKNAN